ncbi:hypothetical protein OIV83_002729 [Microbotryomycetes sp. JL201]|nr:hypothetical protein OIV83_002729 [Microbotryomycetes sp. JL201]
MASDAHGERVTKRKIETVISALDSSLALNAGDGVSSMLGKRKRRTTDVDKGISTPLLVSLLPTRPSRAPAATPPPSYNTTSLSQLVDRISTFKLTTFTAPKPRSLSAAACAMLGWQSASPGRDRIQCVTCHATLVIECGQSGWSSAAGIRLKAELEKQLRLKHLDTCPWRMRACAPGLYKLAIAHRAKELEGVRTRARNIARAGLGKVKAASLDSVASTDLDQLVDIVTSTAEDNKAEVESDVTTDAIVLALLGWDTPINTPPQPSGSSFQTLSCQWCCRRVLASTYLPQESSLAAKSFDAVSQHQSFCPVVDPLAGHWSFSSTNGPLNDAAPDLEPAWKQRLNVLLQRDVRRRTSSNSLASLLSMEGIAGETIAEKQRNKSKAIMSYVRKLLGPAHAAKRQR